MPAVDQVTTGQMRTIYLSEERRRACPRTRTEWAFQLTGLSITIPCHTGSPAVFVAYGDTNVFDLGTGMQSVAMVFQRAGGRWKLATAVNHPDGVGLAGAVHRRGRPPPAPPVLAARQLRARPGPGADQRRDRSRADDRDGLTVRGQRLPGRLGLDPRTVRQLDPAGPARTGVSLRRALRPGRLTRRSRCRWPTAAATG